MLQSLLDRIRRNHALEHATINVLSRRYPDAHLVGFSGPWGFTLYSTLTTEEIVPATMQALERLKEGESHLRVHENCGTNLVVTAALSTLATLLAMGGITLRTPRRFLERLPQAILLNVFALVAARPLATYVQARVTTEADLSGVEVASILTDLQGGLRRIRVHTRQV